MTQSQFLFNISGVAEIYSFINDVVNHTFCVISNTRDSVPPSPIIYAPVCSASPRYFYEGVDKLFAAGENIHVFLPKLFLDFTAQSCRDAALFVRIGNDGMFINTVAHAFAYQTN